MSSDDLERILRALAKRRPFRPFFLEFKNGDRLFVSHPEAVQRTGDPFLHRGPDRSQRIFSGDGVAQVFDPPPS